MLAGELDLALAPSLRNHLNRLHSDGVRHFTLDAAGVLVHRLGRTQRVAGALPAVPGGGRHGVARPAVPSIHRTLEISGLLDVLNVS